MYSLRETFDHSKSAGVTIGTRVNFRCPVCGRVSSHMGDGKAWRELMLCWMPLPGHDTTQRLLTDQKVQREETQMLTGTRELSGDVLTS